MSIFVIIKKTRIVNAMKFKLHSDYTPAGDQQEAIARILANLKQKIPEQVLEGVTGSGKTFTMASVIAAFNTPALIISHNKTLAAQLYQEFRDYFPENAVSYFVSYYDYYQPEAYVPTTDTYIEKETQINENIDKLRLAATTNILTRRDTIVVASVSCIYNIGSPVEYGHFILELARGVKLLPDSVYTRLIQLQYERDDYAFRRGSFRVRGNAIDIYPAYEDIGIRIVFEDNIVTSIQRIHPVTGDTVEHIPVAVIYPAKHYMTDPSKHTSVFRKIEHDLELRLTELRAKGKILEAHRLETRVLHDLDMIREIGYVNGIENYSRYFDGRNPGDAPYSLFDYFSKQTGGQEYLLFIDESHMTIPQIRGMYNGDRSRKQTLIDYGFRLPSALDNRPMKFDEFLRRLPYTLYVSATPDAWEMERVAAHMPHAHVQQLVRPTGLLDPTVEVRPSATQIQDVLKEIKIRIGKHERILVTTLTKRIAEDITDYCKIQYHIKVQYLHSDVETLERSDILDDLRLGNVDVLVGVNLLREGLDLPEVSLVAILDADKEGFLRSRTSLIQTMGRAARHVNGHVILYAQKVTKSMQSAIDIVTERRRIQIEYNTKHQITPESIQKPVRSKLVDEGNAGQDQENSAHRDPKIFDTCTPMERKGEIQKLIREMKTASREMRFEDAARLRDLIETLSKYD